ncbi:hypothetical protein FRC12_018448 [Ceratobasidium sp. 428]|nr:hypothetical protein FRC12_018448 [Ceratobasidium sp. 428]
MSDCTNRDPKSARLWNSYPSPRHLFTVESQLDASSQDARDVSQSLSQPHSQSHSPYNYSNAGMTGPLPYASDSRDARHYGVSSRVPSPSPGWNTGSAPTQQFYTQQPPSPNYQPPSPGYAHPVSSARTRVRPHPHDPNAPSTTEDPDFFVRRGIPQGNHYDCPRTPRVLVPDSQPSSQAAAPPPFQAHSSSVGPDYWQPGYPGGSVLDRFSPEDVIPPTQYNSPPPFAAPAYASQPATQDQRVYTYVSSQASAGNPTRPIDLTMSTPPALPALIAPTQPQAETGVDMRGGGAGRGRGKGRGRGRGGKTTGASSAKSKGKQRAAVEASDRADGDDSVAEPAPKRRRTKPEVDEATIKEKSAIEVIGRARSNSVWNEQNSLDFVSAFFCRNKWEFNRDNQTTAYRDISENVFRGEITVDQLKNFHRAVVYKYKICNEVFSQTGMGSAADDVIGYDVSAKTLREFQDSKLYPIINEVLHNDPAVEKTFGLDLNRPLSPSEDEEITGYNGGDEEEGNSSEDDVPKAAPAANPNNNARDPSVLDLDPTSDDTNQPVRQYGKRLQSKRGASAEDLKGKEDTFKDAVKTLNSMQRSMSSTQNEQVNLFKDQAAYHRQQIDSSKEQEKRDSFRVYLELKRSQEARDAAFYDRVNAGMKSQMEQAEKLAIWERQGLMNEHTSALAKQIATAHAAMPFSTLALLSAGGLCQPKPLRLPSMLQPIFDEIEGPAASVEPTPTPSTPPPQTPGNREPTPFPSPPALSAPAPALNTSNHARAAPESASEAGPGPSTVANMLARAVLED